MQGNSQTSSVRTGQRKTQTLEDVAQTFIWFEQMREKQPVSFDERIGLWNVFRYNDVQVVMNDHARFSSRQQAGTPTPFTGSFLEQTVVAMDPPDHRKLRNLVNLAFTPRAVAQLSDRITQITQTLLDKVKPAGVIDIVTEMAFPLPAMVIAEMLGIPDEDWDVFRRWAYGDTATNNPQPTNRAEMEKQMRTMQQELHDYFTDLLKNGRNSNRGDIINTLSNAEIDGQRLSQEEMVNFCILLLAAGQETTKNLIANAMLCFTDNPESMERLVREPALMPAAIEEVLRYLAPVWNLVRLTTQEVELSGQIIPANQAILPWIASANRDGRQFPNPDVFDIQREPNRHLAFGHGIHFCLGAPLARLEAKIALPMILEQLPRLQRVPGVPIEASIGIVFKIENLPLSFQL